MKNVILTGFLLGAIPISSYASDWMHVFNSDTDKYYIDLDSIKTVNSYNKDLIQAWYKMEVYNDIIKDGMGVGDKALVLYNFDCRKETMGVSQAIRYKGANPLGNSLNVKVPNMRAVIPDTIGAETLDRACTIYKIQDE
ncbi:surface-adhesin E family protein [Acinetobacter lwoffii]|uniref:surface-adhesin E family protein n=1 Tax=Acinetobacter lwoffii TaxID=28090 RepID=UPI002DB82032|nr:surface-adhesin E family protein [Acinetobacter lwoffii]MEB6681039.1 hypothetical protein [Acinetobacter lwoffii]